MALVKGWIICVMGILSLSGCTVPPPNAPSSIPPTSVSSTNGWAGRSAGSGRVLKCGGEDPQAVFFPSMVGGGRNARVDNGVLTFTGVFGFPKNEEISFPVRRPASYMDDPRCVGPDGTGGIWMSITPGQNLWFFILPGRSGGGVQVNQVLPK